MFENMGSDEEFAFMLVFLACFKDLIEKEEQEKEIVEQ